MDTTSGSRAPDVPVFALDELDEVRRMLRSLTPRQREVMLLIGDGARPSEVALELRVTRTTVSFHLRRIQQKVGLHSRRELVKAAMLLVRAAGDTEPHSAEGPS